MDQIRISDLDSTMVAKRTFDDLLAQIQASNLNFHLQLSPFSASISLKKSFIKDKFGNTLLPSHASAPSDAAYQLLKQEHSLLLDDNDQLRQETQEFQTTHEALKETINILEQKVAHVEASALKAFEERNIDINSLKKSVKTAILENEWKGLQAKNKLIKEKDKEIYKLEQMLDCQKSRK